MSTPVRAEVATPDWTKLARSADAAGIVKVESVRSVAGFRTAVARVIYPVAGLEQGQRIAVLAHGLWTCDGTNASEGETVFIWLDAIDRHPRFQGQVSLYRLAVHSSVGAVPVYGMCWSGWGRLEAEKRADWWWVETPNWRGWPDEFGVEGGDGKLHVGRIERFVSRVAPELSNLKPDLGQVSRESLGFGSTAMQALALLCILAAAVTVSRLRSIKAPGLYGEK